MVVVSPRYHECMALTFRTDDEIDAALAVMSEVEGVSRQEILRRAVLERYARQRHQDRVDEATDRVIDEWGDVLERLGSV